MAVQTRVRCSKLVQPADGDVRNPRVASGGALLKWMDSTACLAAEKLAKYVLKTLNNARKQGHWTFIPYKNKGALR